MTHSSALCLVFANARLYAIHFYITVSYFLWLLKRRIKLYILQDFKMHFYTAVQCVHQLARFQQT